jgi:hypothetical protein
MNRKWYHDTSPTQYRSNDLFYLISMHIDNITPRSKSNLFVFFVCRNKLNKLDLSYISILCVIRSLFLSFIHPLIHTRVTTLGDYKRGNTSICNCISLIFFPVSHSLSSRYFMRGKKTEEINALLHAYTN